MSNCAKLCQTVPNFAKLRKMFELSVLWHALTQLGRYWLSLTHFSTYTHSYACFGTQIFPIWVPDEFKSSNIQLVETYRYRIYLIAITKDKKVTNSKILPMVDAFTRHLRRAYLQGHNCTPMEMENVYKLKKKKKKKLYKCKKRNVYKCNLVYIKVLIGTTFTFIYVYININTYIY